MATQSSSKLGRAEAGGVESLFPGCAPICIYFAYMALLSYSLFVMMGTIGFFSTFVLVRYIYASVKVD